MDRHCDQSRAVEHQLQQREEGDRSERTVEEDDYRTRKFGLEHRTDESRLRLQRWYWEATNRSRAATHFTKNGRCKGQTNRVATSR
jgi:hypothetical protein